MGYIFFRKTDERTGVWSNLHTNRYIKYNIHQINEIKEDRPYIRLVKGAVFLEMKRRGLEADCSHLVPSLHRILL